MTLRFRLMGWFGVCLLVAACGDDECKVGESRCVTGTVIRTCVPGADEPAWFVHECKGGEVCEADALASVEDADGGASGSVAACVGSCEQGASECVSAALARYCVNGTSWQLDPCSVGESCTAGTCQLGGDGGVRACEPEARACASEDVEKVCDADGTDWVERVCDEGERCLVDRCAPDPDASCDEASRCLDNQTALRCLGQDRGFETVSCEGDTYCEFGRCRGPVCALGSVCAGANQVRECVDGTEFRDSQCAANEVCKQDGDVASCVPRTCVPGVALCGDPRDPSVDPLKFYSQCLPGIETASGVPEWVVAECTELLTCDPTFLATENPCRQACTPGAQTCMLSATRGIADGYAECQDDGTWGEIERCNPSATTRLQCAIRPTPDASALPEAQCVEPVCAYVFTNQDGVGGACEGTELRACEEDGTLGEAAACEVGICRATSVVTQSDGNLPGACDVDLDCQGDEQRCVYDGLTATPLYQSCEGAMWSAALETCEDDAPCLDYIDGEGLSRVLCGAECVPGHRRCNADDELETCDDAGAWADAQACSTGACAPIGSNDAACVLECLPNATRCTGAIVTAADGSSGYTSEAVCGDDGVLGSASACAAGAVCRVSSSGEHVGCVECVGPEVPGGNALGYMDTRCDTADATRVQSCAADNTWEASRACADGMSCVGPRVASCGTCLSAAGNSVVCTQTNIDDDQVCGGCVANATSLSACTSAAINLAYGGAGSESCATEFGGGAVAWGGQPDCCDGVAGTYLQTTNATCSSMFYGFPGAWAGELDCCSGYQFGSSGPAFAYCAP